MNSQQYRQASRCIEEEPTTNVPITVKQINVDRVASKKSESGQLVIIEEAPLVVVEKSWKKRKLARLRLSSGGKVEAAHRGIYGSNWKTAERRNAVRQILVSYYFILFSQDSRQLDLQLSKDFSLYVISIICQEFVFILLYILYLLIILLSMEALSRREQCSRHIGSSISDSNKYSWLS